MASGSSSRRFGCDGLVLHARHVGLAIMPVTAGLLLGKGLRKRYCR
jgi:hypothetical protein